MNQAPILSLQEIEKRLNKQELPFSGVTELGSAYFNFIEPSFYAATAIHAGHRIRNELHSALKISAPDRLREEDPHTERFLSDFPLQIIANDSRFEYDINRADYRAIYTTPEMAWGLDVWNRTLTAEEMNLSLKKHKEFHQLLDLLTDYLIRQNEFGIIFDLHSYNYQREARLPWFKDPKPAINIGTEAVNRNRFGKILDDLMDRLKNISINGHAIPVAENEVFKGGYLVRRISARNFNQVLTLAIEFKKIFMDEWSGEVNQAVLEDFINQFCKVVKEFIRNIEKEGLP